MKVGITGHQDIGSKNAVDWAKREIDKLIHEYGVTLGLTSLARGADQLYAQVLQNHRIPYVAIVPGKDYEATFSNEWRDSYRHYLQHAEKITVLNHDKADEQAFFDAGKHVVDSSDLMIAVWNGKPAKGLGGTADAVNYALSHNKQVLHLNPVNRTLTVLTPTHS